MPNRREVRRGRGRPATADAGNYEAMYVCLRTDLALYVRKRREENGASLSRNLAELLEEGIAYEILRRREGSP
jgi:hypothetical protein